MTYAIYWVEAVVIWAVSFHVIRGLAGHPLSLLDRAYLVHLVTLSLGALIQSQDVRPEIDALTGVHGLGRWLAFSLILVSFCAFWIVVSLLTREPGAGPARLRGRIVYAAVAIVLMAFLLLNSGTRDDVGARFLAVYGANPYMVGFYLIFLSYIAVVLVDTVRLAGRYSIYGRKKYLRLGMWLLVAGDVGGLIYVLYLGATALARYASLPMPPARRRTRRLISGSAPRCSSSSGRPSASGVRG